MNLSAAFMALLGAALTFAPQELLARYGSQPNAAAVLLAQVLGAVYLGFAMLNWMARENLIGGIYSRPVGMGNFTHFFIVALAMIKVVTSGAARTIEIEIATAIYGAFAIWFGMVVFTH